jgi:hypothetical protein
MKQKHKEMKNPFVIKPYESKELFCDREKELELMLTNVLNKSDMTLMSQRRMGKTGLIFRLFDEIKTNYNEIQTIYFDIFSSRSINDFIKLFAESAIKAFPAKSSIGEKLMAFIKSLRPQMSFDNITGEPQLQISYQTPHEKEYTLKGLFEFLDSQDTPIVIAIDEFQQIREYPEQNMGALLRTYIQQTKNLTFIFSGSKRHLMTDIFTNEKKPFYSSTVFVTLDKISELSYFTFIRNLFEQSDRQIDNESISFILEWTRRHTYYTQQLCHTIFANNSTNIRIDDVKTACEQILSQSESFFLQYRQLLSVKQWNYLIALAKEREVSQISSAAFLSKYNIGNSSTSKRIIESLNKKGIVYQEIKLDRTSYSIDDEFFSHWLERI